MLNQITIEGYLVRSWEYKGRRYMRLANHRPELEGVVSDYFTVQVDPSLPFDPIRLKPGRLLSVTGRLTGRDILEPLGRIVAKSGLTVELPAEISAKMIVRPTVEILALQVALLDDPHRKARKRKRKEAPNPALPVLTPLDAGADLAAVVST